MSFQTNQEITHAFLVATHHGRIVCFLNLLAFLSKPFVETGFNSKKSKRGLQNTATVKFTYIPSDKKVIAQLLYEGISNSKKKDKYHYWTNKNEQFTFNLSEYNCNKLFPGIYYPIIFYMFRHGLGIHNTMSTFEKLINPPLDPLLVEFIGIAEIAEYIDIDLHKHRITKKSITLISSPLLRTIETMSILMSMANRLPTKIYVLPCLHEFESADKKANGKCDNRKNKLHSPGFFSIINAENISKCIANTQKCTNFYSMFGLDVINKKKEIPRVLATLDKITPFVRENLFIDWSFFFNFDCTLHTFTEFFQNFTN